MSFPHCLKLFADPFCCQFAPFVSTLNDHRIGCKSFQQITCCSVALNRKTETSCHLLMSFLVDQRLNKWNPHHAETIRFERESWEQVIRTLCWERIRQILGGSQISTCPTTRLVSTLSEAFASICRCEYCVFHVRCVMNNSCHLPSSFVLRHTVSSM